MLRLVLKKILLKYIKMITFSSYFLRIVWTNKIVGMVEKLVINMVLSAQKVKKKAGNFTK